MDSWRKVRGFYDWDVVVRIEPTPFAEELASICYELENPRLKVTVNPQIYGVLHHPWVGFEELFVGYDFVVRGEDDLPVSSDILEYFEWAAEKYRHDPEIATVIGFSMTHGDPSEVERRQSFSPWVWGTWHDRWKNVIGPTWDHDYSTNNGTPYAEAGWDWNLDKRVLPAHGLKSIYPLASRVQNIGVFGVHGTIHNFVQSESFELERDSSNYYER